MSIHSRITDRDRQLVNGSARVICRDHRPLSGWEKVGPRLQRPTVDGREEPVVDHGNVQLCRLFLSEIRYLKTTGNRAERISLLSLDDRSPTEKFG